MHPIRIKQNVPWVKEPHRVIVPLTNQEVNRFFHSIRTWRDRSIIGFMLFCGLRSREVILLKMVDIQLSDYQAIIWGKGNRERIVPLPEDLIKALNKYLHLETPFDSTFKKKG